MVKSVNTNKVEMNKKAAVMLSCLKTQNSVRFVP